MIVEGDIFDFLIVEKSAGKRNGKNYWQCSCKCGNKTIVQESHLLTGHTKSCGCFRRKTSENKARNLCGQRFGRLTALNATQKRHRDSVVWLCKCDCGKEIMCAADNLVRGKVKSCGCLQEEQRKENMAKAIHFVDGTCVEKIASQKTISSNTSGHRGVSRRKNGTWRACLNFQGKRYDLGTYKTFEEAVEARLEGEEIYRTYLEKYYEMLKKQESMEDNNEK